MRIPFIRIPLINKFTCTEKQLPFFIKNLKEKKLIPILDYANENYVNTDNNILKIKNLINTYPNNMIAIKLSSFGIQDNNWKSKKNIFEIIDMAIDSNCKILIDAEYDLIQNDINKITDEAIEMFNKNKVNIYKTYQMYRIDSYNLLEYDITKKRDYSLGIKLVRGAYYNTDNKFNILYNKIEDTHFNYNKGIKLFVNNSKSNDLLMCATHNIESINYTKNFINNDPNLKNKIEFAHLLGMSDKLSNQLTKDYKVYKYLPYGDFCDTLPYMIRRLYENYPMIINLVK